MPRQRWLYMLISCVLAQEKPDMQWRYQIYYL